VGELWWLLSEELWNVGGTRQANMRGVHGGEWWKGSGAMGIPPVHC